MALISIFLQKSVEKYPQVIIFLKKVLGRMDLSALPAEGKRLGIRAEVQRWYEALMTALPSVGTAVNYHGLSASWPDRRVWPEPWGV